MTARRREIIKSIEAAQSSRVLTYITADRSGAAGQIVEDAIRAMHDHLPAFCKCERIDLVLFSIGRRTDVPWRIVTLIREFTTEFSVLVPYKAMSAATMIGLGADAIVTGRKGELGSIDPTSVLREEAKAVLPYKKTSRSKT